MSYCSNPSALCGLYADMFIQLLFITTSSRNITILHRHHPKTYIPPLMGRVCEHPSRCDWRLTTCEWWDPVLGGGEAVHLAAALELPGDKESLGVDAGHSGDKWQ